MKRFIVVVSLLVVIGLGVGGYFYFSGGSDLDYDSVLVKREDVVSEVSVTGKVVPASEVMLSFEGSGRVREVNFDVGDQVAVGDVLVALHDDEVRAQLAQAKASVEVETAKLNELLRGSRDEEVRVQEVRVGNAKSALSEDKQALLDAVLDAYTRSDDAVRSKIDDLFDNSSSESVSLSFTPNSSELRALVERGRQQMEILLASWQKSISSLALGDDISSEGANARSNLNLVRDFLDDTGFVLSGLESKVDLTQSTIDGYQSGVSNARATVNTALSALSTAEEGVQASQATVSLEEEELTLLLAGTADEEIVAQEAVLRRVEAEVDQYRATQDKLVLKSPIHGFVTLRDVEVGEVVSPNAQVFELISLDVLRLEAFIPEADIARVSLRDSAKVTLDAYGDDEVFQARVYHIDPADTEIEGVSTYKVELIFLGDDDRVKPGMTANIDVVDEVREQVLAVPQRALVRDGAGYVVRLVKGGVIQEMSVMVGIRGSSGVVEILEGVREGDEVVTFVRE